MLTTKASNLSATRASTHGVPWEAPVASCAQALIQDDVHPSGAAESHHGRIEEEHLAEGRWHLGTSFQGASGCLRNPRFGGVHMAHGEPNARSPCHGNLICFHHYLPL